MFKTALQKKIAIAIALFLIICLLLLIFRVVSFDTLLFIVTILPILFIADISFITLPITMLIFLGMTFYTLIKKDYQKLNYAYEIILTFIIFGIINCEFDNILNTKKDILQTSELKIYWLAFFGISLICGCLFISRKKDTRLYILIYGLPLVFYLIYKLIESFE